MKKKFTKKAIVLGGSRGMGRAIADALKVIGCDVFAASSKDINTADLSSVKRFCKKHKQTDILILNTGGPPAKDFFAVTQKEWERYHNQLFLSFCLLLKNLTVNDNGYIFLITSHVIKEPTPNLVVSTAYRLAFAGVFKTLSPHYAKHGISCINIAPGPIKTDRLRALIPDMKSFESDLPMRRAGYPQEIGNFIKAIVKENIHYLSGVTIVFDGARSRSIF